MIRYDALNGATVCICASTRAGEHVLELERRLGLAGASVLAPVPHAGEISPLDCARLVALHLRKIEAADIVVVANVGGYTGPGTGQEIARAMRLGKTVMFLEDPAVLETAPEEYGGYVGRIRDLALRPADGLPGQLARGTVLHIRPVGGDGRAAWFRVADVHRFPGVLALAAAIDPARALPGTGTEELAQNLSTDYPGRDEQDYVALELEFLGEQGSGQPQPAEPHGPAVMLLARGREGAVALERDPCGTLSLPRTPVGPREQPFAAAVRHAQELFGTALGAERLLALDRDPDTASMQYLFDAGTVEPGQPAHALKTGSADGARLVFADPDKLHRLVTPRTARVIDTVLADVTGAVLLEHGYRVGRQPEWEWLASEQPPAGVPVTQAGVWAFDRDGRVVLQHRIERGGAFGLPAGSPEPEDRDWLCTAAREAFEESQILIDQRQARLIGFQVTYSDPRLPNGLAQARYVAPLLGYLPIAPDTDPKLTTARAPYRRYLCDIRHAARLLDWGPHAQAQTRAAEQAALELGLPADRPAAASYRDNGDPELADVSPTWDVLL
ncbi:NUDIX hydrolase [Actinospica sp. MGRD01-02]|uniref:NUDIX hydrolase n=1 Tax=Actinospica acidithermotolerans TaxID=2828514 RepID=A0A941IJL7_9ACTN|nr:NUDIX hydrolase [Actinospica acidithermotolerans]MBR7825836.1 NUDIX hydrolase [Actinospica acidithermotolerans]